MTTAENSFMHKRAIGKIWLAALIFSLTITAGGLTLTMAAGPDLRPPPAPPRPSVGQPLPSVRPQAHPKKPAKIKLQRNAKGDYTWDITGENVDEILSFDRRLQKAFFAPENTVGGK
ncbi:MAG TPA: hypothetical protein DEQ20_11265 [Desulfobulbaceae bacterium]|nr:MAG: hypothetical protein A2520_01045 [Deltaproteobacteria bacterium RIFOXYD12_FULL_53_23]HCC55480.1 hypothetical protein [Desulfobulbaceae bacterium]